MYNITRALGPRSQWAFWPGKAILFANREAPAQPNKKEALSNGCPIIEEIKNPREGASRGFCAWLD